MVEVRMRHQHQINGRQVSNSQPRTPQPLQHKKPAREVRVDHHALSAHLHEETGMADEGHTQLAVRGKTRDMGLTAWGIPGGMAHQSPELRGAFAEGPIAKRLLDHPKLVY